MLGKMQINLLFSELIRTFDLRSKVLSFENAQINLAFCSLIRTFAAVLIHYYYENSFNRLRQDG